MPNQTTAYYDIVAIRRSGLTCSTTIRGDNASALNPMRTDRVVVLNRDSRVTLCVNTGAVLQTTVHIQEYPLP